MPTTVEKAARRHLRDRRGARSRRVDCDLQGTDRTTAKKPTEEREALIIRLPPGLRSKYLALCILENTTMQRDVEDFIFGRLGIDPLAGD